MLEGPDGDDGVIGLVRPMIAPALLAHLDPGPRVAPDPARLRGAEGEPDGLRDAGGTCEPPQQPAPAAADIEHACRTRGTGRFDVMVELADLGFGQIIRAVEEGTGIDHLGIEPELEELAADVVVDADRFGGCALVPRRRLARGPMLRLAAHSAGYTRCSRVTNRPPSRAAARCGLGVMMLWARPRAPKRRTVK